MTDSAGKDKNKKQSCDRMILTRRRSKEKFGAKVLPDMVCWAPLPSAPVITYSAPVYRAA